MAAAAFVILTVSWLTGPAARGADGPPSPPRTNLLLIVSDDLAARLACYGDPLVKSPNIDALAARGVRFDHAYCQYPLCNSSRASFLTGRRPDACKVWDNATHFRAALPDVQTLGQAFQQAGYYVARVGKLYHYGVPRQIGTDGLDDPPSWTERFNPKGEDVMSQRPKVLRLGYDEDTKLATLTPNHTLASMGGVMSWLAADGDDDLQTDARIADKAIDLLKAKRDQPFFLAVGFFRPHTPYVSPKKYFDLYPPEKITLPTTPAGYRDTVPRPALTIRTAEDAMTDAMRRQAIQAYHASTTFMDAQVGRVVEELDRLKLADRTVIVFMSDHGYHLYEHGLWQKMTLFENSARVPLIIAPPGGANGGKTCPRVVELLDLYPTLAELCGVAAPKTLDGVSLKPLLDQPDAACDRPAFTQLTRGIPGTPVAVRGYSVRTARYRYTEWESGQKGAELYDHDADPGELKNLATDPAHAKTVADLKKLLPPVAAR
jgi:uncharacterized sulfatase